MAFSAVLLMDTPRTARHRRITRAHPTSTLLDDGLVDVSPPVFLFYSGSVPCHPFWPLIHAYGKRLPSAVWIGGMGSSSSREFRSDRSTGRVSVRKVVCMRCPRLSQTCKELSPIRAVDSGPQKRINPADVNAILGLRSMRVTTIGLQCMLQHRNFSSAAVSTLSQANPGQGGTQQEAKTSTEPKFMVHHLAPGIWIITPNVRNTRPVFHNVCVDRRRCILMLVEQQAAH